MALVPLTLWRLAETVLGLHPSEHHEPDPDPDDFLMVNRLKALGLAAVYAAVAAMAVNSPWAAAIQAPKGPSA